MYAMEVCEIGMVGYKRIESYGLSEWPSWCDGEVQLQQQAVSWSLLLRPVLSQSQLH